MNIPDTIELMESRIDRQISLIDADDTYPCAACGERKPMETTDWICTSLSGDGPMVCPECYFGAIK